MLNIIITIIITTHYYRHQHILYFTISSSLCIMPPTTNCKITIVIKIPGYFGILLGSPLAVAKVAATLPEVFDDKVPTLFLSSGQYTIRFCVCETLRAYIEKVGPRSSNRMHLFPRCHFSSVQVET